MEAKHQQILLDYLRDANLSYVLQNSIRTLVQLDQLPDNPFGPLYRHFSFFGTKNDLDRALPTLRNNSLNQANAPMAYLLTNSERKAGVFGLPGVMHRTNTEYVAKLRAALSDVIKDFARTLGSYRLEVISSISSAAIFKSPAVPYAEVAHTPLVLRTDCLIEGPAFDPAFTVFADFVYDDIMYIGSANSLHYIKDYVIELTNESKRKVSFLTMRDNKQQFISELRAATIQRKESYIRLLLFVPNLMLYQQDEMIRSGSVQRFLATNLDKEDLIDHFEYVETRKCYYLHYLDSLRKGGGGVSVSFKSMAYVPCESLYEGVFFNVENAQRYASIFYGAEQNPYQVPSLQDYTAKKKAKVVYFLKAGLTSRALWALLELVLTTPDTTVRQAQLEELQLILSHEACSMYTLQRQCKVLRLIINAYYDSNLRHFLKLAETLFAHLKAAVLSSFSRGCVAEIRVLKPYIEKILDALSVNSSKTINLHDQTLIVLSRLEDLCRTVADNTVEMLLRHTPAVDALIVSLGYTESLTKTQLLAMKTTAQVVRLPAEIKRRKIPSKNAELTVLCSYLVDTGVLSLLIATNRELLLSYPLLPTPLHFYSARLIAGMAHFDMFRRRNEEIISAIIKEPIEERPGVFTQNPDQKLYPGVQLPYLLGTRAVLRICAIEECAFAKLIYHPYAPASMQYTAPPGYTLTASSCLGGMSVLNELLNSKQRCHWDVCEDIYMQGASFNASVQFFIEFLLDYASWVYQTTDAAVLGFFTPHANEPLAPIAKVISVNERKEAQGLILSAYQANAAVSFRLLLPFKGTGAEAYYRQFSLFFNLHYTSSSGKTSSLRPVKTFEDHIRVFFDLESFQSWGRLLPPSSSNHLAIAQLESHLKELRGSGEFVKAFQLSILLAQLKDNDIEALKALRLFETPIDVLYEVGTLCGVVLEALRMKEAGERKVGTDFLLSSFRYFRFYLEKTAQIERNAYLESLQSGAVNLVRDVEGLLTDQNYTLALKLMKRLRRLLYGACTQALAVCDQALVLTIEA